jgi:hypothetical protein
MTKYRDAYPCLKILVELSYLIDRIKEDKNLRLFIDLIVEILENSPNDILVHFGFIRKHFEVVFNSLQGDDLFPQLFLYQFVDVEFDDIFYILLIEIQELFFHGGRASNQIRPIIFAYFQDLGQGFFLLLVDVVDLINGDELAVIEVKVSPLKSVNE